MPPLPPREPGSPGQSVGKDSAGRLGHPESIPQPVQRPLPEGATTLQRSLLQLQAQKLPRDAFARDAIKLILDAAGVQAAIILEYNHPGRLNALASIGAEPKVLDLLLGRSGKWIPLRCVNERNVHIIEPAQHNPFVPQPLINAIGTRYLGIGSFPLMQADAAIGVVLLFSFVEGLFTEALLANLAEALPICAAALATPTAPAAGRPTLGPPRSPLNAAPASLQQLRANRGRPTASPEMLPANPPPPAGILDEPIRPVSAPLTLRSQPTARATTTGATVMVPRGTARVIVPARPAAPAAAGVDVPRLVQMERQRVQQLERQLAALRATVEGQASLLQEAELLRQELDDTRERADAAQAQTEKLRAALSEADQGARLTAASLEDLGRERNELQQKLEASAASLQQYQSTVVELEARIAQTTALQETVAAAESTRAALSADLLRVREELVAAQATLLQREDAAATAQAEARTLAGRLAETQATFEAKQTLTQTIFRQRDEALAAAQAEAKALAAQVAEFQAAQRRANDEAVAGMVRERDDLQRRLDAAQADAEQRRARISELEDQLRRQATTGAPATQVANDAARASTDAELLELREALLQLQSTHAETEAALRQRNEDLAIARFEGLSLATRLADAQDKADRLEANQLELARTRSDLEALKAEHRTLQRESEQALSTLAKKDRADDAVARAWTSQMAAVESERQRLQEELARISAHMETTAAQFDAQITEGILERQNLASRVAELEAERPQLLARIEALQQAIPTETAPPSAAEDEENSLARELLQAFQFESAECIQECEKLLLQLEQNPGHRETVYGLFRQFHTLKGAAAAVGLDEAAAQLHEGESLLEAIEQGHVVATPQVVDFVFRLTDSIVGLINKAAGTPATAADGSERKILSNVAEEIARLRAGVTDAAPAPAQAGEPVAGTTERAAAIPPELDTGVVRVATARLDDLASKIGELDLTRGRLHQDIQTLAELRDQLHEWRLALAEIEQQPQTPSSADSAANTLRDVAAYTGLIAQELEGVMTTLDQHGREFSGISAGLQQQVNDLRLVPLELVFRRLARPTRDAARQEGKQVDLEIGGGNVPLNREVIDALYAPLLHLVRNSVAHGIETPDVREARGKSRSGTIWVTAYVRGDATIITVADDGAGLNCDAVLRKARSRGMVGEDETPSRDVLLSLILQPGFSTKEAVSDLAGRGVGMDVVAREVDALGGTMDIESEDGYGMTVRMAFPGNGIAAPADDAAAADDADPANGADPADGTAGTEISGDA